MNPSNEYYSNCLLEAMKAKLKYWNDIKILHVRSHDGLHHFMWYDRVDNNVYDFQQLDEVKHWLQLLWYRGNIRIRPYNAFARWKEVNTSTYDR